MLLSMQIIIPLSGLGSRFVKAGYQDIKPLIPVHGKPIIEHVCNLFPGENDFLFIVREKHAESTPVLSVLKNIMPEAKIKIIPGSKKGPVWAVSQAFDNIDDNKPCIVNYCDFYQQWDYKHFKQTIEFNNCDGAIPCYTGFHPHLIPEKNLYASCKTDKNNYLLEIREKFAWNEDKKKDKHSVGMYYIKSGRLLKKYYNMQIEKDIDLNGEYYSSLTYNLMVEDQLKIFVYDQVSHFCQWGTPQDLEEYVYWSEIFTALQEKPYGH